MTSSIYTGIETDTGRFVVIEEIQDGRGAGTFRIFCTTPDDIGANCAPFATLDEAIDHAAELNREYHAFLTGMDPEQGITLLDRMECNDSTCWCHAI